MELLNSTLWHIITIMMCDCKNCIDILLAYVLFYNISNRRYIVAHFLISTWSGSRQSVRPSRVVYCKLEDIITMSAIRVYVEEIQELSVQYVR